MSGAIDAAEGILEGLLPARWAGIDFDMPDTSTSNGRRLAEHLFPGLDYAAYDDFGQVPEEISINGVIIGDDYIERAKSIRKVMASAGPRTLTHPWLGELRVLLQEPGEIKFSATELRVARFSARFKVLKSGFSVQGISTIVRMQAAFGGLFSGAIRQLSVLHAMSSLAASYGIARRIDSLITGASGGRSIDVTIHDLVQFGSGVGAALSSKSETVVGQKAANQAAVAPSAEQTVANLLSQQDAVSTISQYRSEWLVAASALTDAIETAPSENDRVALQAVAAIFVSEAAKVFLHDVVANRSEAQAIRSAFMKPLSHIQDDDLAPLAEELASALHDDINEVIGRLPEVKTFILPRPMPAIHIAHHLAGNDPTKIELFYEMIIARNNVRHPAMIDVGTAIEIEQ